MEGVRHAAAEIAHSEQHFVDDMEVLRSVFAAPLREWLAGLASGIGEVDIGSPNQAASLVERLFAPLDQVLSFARLFLNELIAVEGRGTWRAVFEKHEEAMCKAYGSYVAAYNAVFAELSRLRSKSRALDAFLRCCELQPANKRRQTLASLCIMPVQRGPRYVLLLGELRKRAQKAGAEYQGGDDDAALEAALNCAKRAAAAIDAEIARETSRVASVRRVSGTFTSHDTVNNWQAASRAMRVVHDDQLVRTMKRGRVECYLVLFEDALAYGDAVQSNASSLLPGRPRRRASVSLQAGLVAEDNLPTALVPRKSDEFEDGGGRRYTFREEVPIQLVWAARGDESESAGGIVSQAAALDPWEFVVLLGPKVGPVVFSASTPSAAFDWVEKITKAGHCKQQSSDARPPDNPHTAFLFRQSKVVSGDFELVPHASNAFYVALPAPPNTPTRPVQRLTTLDSPIDTAGADLFPEATAPQDTEFLATVPTDKGLGLELRNERSSVIVTSLAMDSSALDAGVRPGDHVVRIDTEYTYTTTDVVNALQRAKNLGPTVKILFGRPAMLHRQSSVPQGVESLPESPPPPPPMPLGPPPPNSCSALATSALEPPATPPPPPPNRPALAQSPLHGSPVAAPNRQDGDNTNLGDSPAALAAAKLGFEQADVVEAIFAGAKDVGSIANWILDKQSAADTTVRSVGDEHLTPPPLPPPDHLQAPAQHDNNPFR